MIVLFTLSIRVSAQWSTNPAVNNAICADAGLQFTPQIASDGAGGAIIVWMDMRASNGYSPKAYAQRIDVNGNVK